MVVLKRAESKPVSILVLMELIADLLPPGVINIVNRYGRRRRRPGQVETYLAQGKEEGAKVLCGGKRANLGGDPAGGFYIKPTLLQGHNNMRIFHEEIFGLMLAVTTLKDKAEAQKIANDTPYGLGAGVWSRDGSRAYRMGRAIHAGRVWTNCCHAHPAQALIEGLRQGHGAVIFCQLHGCCDGSSPMCFAPAEMPLTADDRLLGEVCGALLHASRSQCDHLLGLQLTLDAVAGCCGGFSLEDDTGLRFVQRLRLWTDEEARQLRLQPLQASMQPPMPSRSANP